jgi:hypothetical protein
MLGDVASPEDPRRSAESLRKVVAATAVLPDNTADDAQLRDRLMLAAEVLEAAARAECS